MAKARPQKKKAKSPARNGSAHSRTLRAPTIEGTGIGPICDRIAHGESLRSIARDLGMHGRRVLDWIEADPDRTAQYARAREARADHYAEEIIEISDGAVGASTSDVQARRLQVDSRKWIASKMLPKRYGDKLDASISGQFSFTHLTDEQLDARLAQLIPQLIELPGVQEALKGTGFECVAKAEPSSGGKQGGAEKGGSPVASGRAIRIRT